MGSLGQMDKMRRREKPMLRLSFPHGQISHQINNTNTQPILALLSTHHRINLNIFNASIRSGNGTIC